jgi:hypothetical protein
VRSCGAACCFRPACRGSSTTACSPGREAGTS